MRAPLLILLLSVGALAQTSRVQLFDGANPVGTSSVTPTTRALKVDCVNCAGGGGGGTTFNGVVYVDGGVIFANQGAPGASAWLVGDGAGPLTVDGTVTVGNSSLQVVGPLTDTQLRASTLPVSGSVTVGDGAGPLTVDGTVGISGTVPVSGTFWQSTQPISGSVTVSDGAGPLTVDGTVAVSGTVPVSGTFWQATQPVSLATNTPDVTDRSARLLGHVTVDNASMPVTGTFWQATQPVSLATNTPDVTDRAARLLGHVTVDNASLAVTGTFWQATQPVSGTVASTQSGTWSSRSLDGAGNALASSSTTPAGTEQALIVRNIPSGTQTVSVSGTVPVSGTFWQATQPVSIASTVTVSGTVTSNQGTANATPWNENLAQVGGSAITLRSGAFGQAAVPVYNNAMRLNTFTAALNAVSSGALVANTSKQVLSIEHAATSTKTVRIRRILISGWVSTASAAAAATIEWRVFYGTAASSAGTVVTVQKTNAASPTPEAAVKSIPTIVAATGPIMGPTVSNATGTAGLVIGTLVPSYTFYDWQESGETEPLTLRAGQLESLVLAVQSTSTPTVTIHATIIFTEE
jgi:hypothetical protein